MTVEKGYRERDEQYINIKVVGLVILMLIYRDRPLGKCSWGRQKQDCRMC